MCDEYTHMRGDKHCSEASYVGSVGCMIKRKGPAISITHLFGYFDPKIPGLNKVGSQ